MTDMQNLPASMIELAETLGLRIALSLIQNFGGQDVKWPKAPRADHPVVKALGELDAHLLYVDTWAAERSTSRMPGVRLSAPQRSPNWRLMASTGQLLGAFWACRHAIYAGSRTVPLIPVKVE